MGPWGDGLPASIGVQVAHPDVVIDIAGEASVQMTIQEMSTAAQYDLPIKIFILNNEYMGMVGQWQELLHGGRYSHSYTAALPDFVKLAEAYQGVGIRAEKPSETRRRDPRDDRGEEAGDLRSPGRQARQLLPRRLRSGEAHNHMLMGDDLTEEDRENAITEEGKATA